MIPAHRRFFQSVSLWAIPDRYIGAFLVSIIWSYQFAIGRPDKHGRQLFMALDLYRLNRQRAILRTAAYVARELSGETFEALERASPFKLKIPAKDWLAPMADSLKRPGGSKRIMNAIWSENDIRRH
jgi:hypothetical protein